MTLTAEVDLQAVRAAANRIAPHVHRTPVMTSRTLEDMTGRKLLLKCENFQRMGAFKMRGALNAVLQLSDDAAHRGVVTHSSGNHAQALALAARLRGIPAHIVMPSTAPIVKRRGVEGYGGIITLCEPNLAARTAAADDILRRTGGTMIHPYDHPHVIAGQGTVALELLEQADDIAAILVPVSGGGLISGIALAVKALRPSVRIIGVEPAAADDAARSKSAGRRVTIDQPRSVADGLCAQLGDLTWPIIRDHVDEIVTVTEAQIIAAMRLLWERQKIVVEASGAVTLAAALTDEFRARPALPGRLALVLSGGNVDLDRLPWLHPQV